MTNVIGMCLAVFGVVLYNKVRCNERARVEPKGRAIRVTTPLIIQDAIQHEKHMFHSNIFVD